MKFLKFSWSKLIIFIILIALTLYSSVSMAGIYCKMGGPCPQPFPVGNSFFKGVYNVLGFPFILTEDSLGGIIGIGLNLIYLYILSCLIVWIYKKFK